MKYIMGSSQSTGNTRQDRRIARLRLQQLALLNEQDSQNNTSVSNNNRSLPKLLLLLLFTYVLTGGFATTSLETRNPPTKSSTP